MHIPPTHDAAISAMQQIDPQEYAARRNYIGGGTGLSAYITRGALTLPQIRDHVLEHNPPHACEKLIFELAWREYWQHEWHYRGDTILTDIKRPQEPVMSHLLPKAVHDAATGIDTLDSEIRALYDTGYMHNHARMWIAGLVCNIAQTHWWQPSTWLYYHLLDGDPASNSLSWQWVAGTFSHKKYLPAQRNINMYSDSTQTDTYLDHDYEHLAAMEVPHELSERVSLQQKWQAPESDRLVLDPERITLLYHPFWINAAWRSTHNANKILLLSPSWFDAWPVSIKVTDFIVDLARDIPGMQVIVGEFTDFDFGDEVYFVAHPYTSQWQGHADTMPKLFPHAPDKSFNSFMSFYTSCQKHHQNNR